MHSDGNHLCPTANEFCLAVLQETNPEFILLPVGAGCQLCQGWTVRSPPRWQHCPEEQHPHILAQEPPWSMHFLMA